MRNFGLNIREGKAVKTKLLTNRDVRDMVGLGCVVVGVGVFCGGLIYAAGNAGAAMACGAVLLIVGLAIGPPPDSEWPFKS